MAPRALILRRLSPACSEFLSDEDTTGRLFWSYVDAGLAESSRRVTAGESLDASTAVGLAQPLLPTLTFEVLRLALGARAYSPAVEYQRQLAVSSVGFADCRAATHGGVSGWADVVTDLPGGTRVVSVCNPGALAAAVRASSSPPTSSAPVNGTDRPGATYDVEHWYPAGTPSAQLAAETAPLVILYAAIAAKGASEWHAAARDLAAAGTARALLRHWLPASDPVLPDFDDEDQDPAPLVPSSGLSAGALTWLSGYGVGLDVKSTEYKVIDDRAAASEEEERKAKGWLAVGPASPALQRLARLDGTLAELVRAAEEAAAASDASQPGTFVGGVDWAVLAARRPEKVTAIGKAKVKAAKALAKAAASAGNGTAVEGVESPGLSVWDGRLLPFEVGDLGLQASAVVLDAARRAEAGEVGAGADPLAALVTVSSNFPSLARSLSRVPVPASLRAEAETNGRFVQPGQSLMTINGVQIDPTAPTFNLFSLFNVLRAEARVAAQLDTLPLAPVDRRRVQALAIKKSGESGGAAGGAEAGPIRIDVVIEAADEYVQPSEPASHPYRAHNHSLVVWVADVETDDMFATWPSDLRGLMQQSWQLHQIRRNLYSTLVLGDYGSAAGQKAVSTVMQFAGMRAPIAFGVILLPGTSAGEADALAGAGGAGAPPAVPLVVNYTARLTGLQAAQLLADAVMRHGKAGGKAFLTALATASAALTDVATAAAHKAAAAAAEADGTPVTEEFLANIVPPEDAGMLTVVAAVEAYAGAAQVVMGAWTKGTYTDAARAALVDADGAARRAVKAVARWARARGLAAPGLIVNGRVGPTGGVGGVQAFQQELMTLVSGDMQLLQQAVFGNKLDDAVSPSVLHALVGRATALTGAHARDAARARKAALSAPRGAPPPPAVLYALPGSGTVSPRWHPSVLAGDEEQVFLPLSAPEAGPLRAFTPYFAAPGTVDDVKPVSLTLFDDLDTAEGLFSLASMLSYIRVPLATEGTESAPEGCLPSSTLGPLLCPTAVSHLRADVARDLRVGALHVPALSVGSVSASAKEVRASGVGEALSTLLSLVSGAHPAEVYVRTDDRAVIAAGLTDLARSAALRPGQQPDAALTVFAMLVTEWLGGAASPIKARQAEKLVGALNAVVTGVAAPPPVVKNAEGEDVPLEAEAAMAAAVYTVLMAGRASADIARRMLPDALPGTRSVEDGMRMRVRGLAANGRILSLLPVRGTVKGGATGSVPLAGVCENGDYPAANADMDGKAALAACVGPEDVAVLMQHERGQRGSAVAALLQTCDFGAAGVDADTTTAEWLSGVVQSAASAVGASLTVPAGSAGGRATGRIALRTDILSSEITAFTSSRGGEATVQEASGLYVIALIDPASEDAQRYAPLLVMLRDRLGATVRVHLNPGRGFSDLPVKSFFRYVLPAEIPVPGAANKGVEAGAEDLSHPRAVFAWLPPSSVLTLKIYTPEPWNTQLAAAGLDTDNLKLDRDGRGGAGGASTRLLHAGTASHSATYELKDLLAAGTCIDGTAGSIAFPNGMQLTLGPKAEEGSITSDTLVMQNGGYWQLKAQPGVWSARLAEGRARDLFEVVAPTRKRGGTISANVMEGSAFLRRLAGGDAEAQVVDSLDVLVRDFTGPTTLLMVRKRPGRERELLLSTLGAMDAGEEGEAVSKGGMLSSVGSLFSSLGGRKPVADAVALSKPLVHVFSLASGWLYERFLKIMIAAAVHASPSVRLKFWLVENFLSPGFKAFVPTLAASLGAEVGFVTYKWPNWLRGQSEKQRLIWGYKILFLDVLFPLNVTKVIYIDADQVVRSDLRELWEHDLEGAAYAYTPFCTSRQDTLGYQFWRDGFWKDHLKGRPYHISALYVVDLVAFRRAAVGDNLRAIYDQLSRDPNSLSNLDQDLPNYAQTMIPIHSLPQEWLWCESWCSESSKVTPPTHTHTHTHTVSHLPLPLHPTSGRLQDDRPVQQPPVQGAEAGHGAPRHLRLPLPLLMGRGGRAGVGHRGGVGPHARGGEGPTRAGWLPPRGAPHDRLC